MAAGSLTRQKKNLPFWLELKTGELHIGLECKGLS